ncbi:MAG: GWxTD domain-containing protein [Candidatus Aminicenantes bacterium]|nr:GWxTD domain-containing protein [Candidatus Aminicenantes bacterium]
MKNKLIILLFFSFALILFAESKKSTNELPERYGKWFKEEVVYIITPKEKEVFFKLESDRERDIFIEAFWKQRDPTPGTPENEFKKEHYRRINYANQMFGRAIATPGWKTDRGRIYIILGPPMNVQRFTSYTKIYPTEVWSYHQAPRGGLPPAFHIVFFDKKGLGEYVLYSPMNDGPQSLLIGYQSHPHDYFGAYQKLYDVNTFLAQISISLIPGEAVNPGQPTMASDLLVQKINKVPQKEVKDIYADNFLKYKDIIEVEYTANYIGNENLVQIITDHSGTTFVNYFIELEKLSLNLYQDTYYTDIKVNGVLTTLSDQIIYQFEKIYSVKLNQEQFEILRNSSFAIYDMFPLIPGTYKFSLLLKNTVSKEFTSFEKDIYISENKEQLLMTPPLLAYGLKQSSLSSSSLIPFQTNEGQLLCSPRNIFLKNDTLYVFFQIRGLNDNLKDKAKINFTFFRGEEEFFTVSKKLTEYSETGENILAGFSLKDFPSSDFKLVISLSDPNNQQILTWSKYFSVSPTMQIARPQIFSKVISSVKGALVHYIKGIQYLNKGDVIEGSELLEKAFHQNPRIIDFALGLSRANLLLKHFEKIEPILLPFLDNSNPNYEVLNYLSEAKKNLSQYEEAIKFYKDIISHFGLRLDTLNSLGYCYYRLGDYSEARTAWKKSLEINPNQREIKKLLDSIKN